MRGSGGIDRGYLPPPPNAENKPRDDDGWQGASAKCDNNPTVVFSPDFMIGFTPHPPAARPVVITVIGLVAVIFVTFVVVVALIISPVVIHGVDVTLSFSASPAPPPPRSPAINPSQPYHCNNGRNYWTQEHQQRQG